ncbi:protein N-terminal asparagine amidohydrolase-like [Acanthaster planci]|uniref:Protein N-terminal asparagine amidohydrolase-like n=1 Tax=Acanthaster planci TaxID=133434 RepID=A0A8B7ZBJ1_ACAPL|nr:protein N-terminal asparagine amidohydrolase-like [Acanthaster planci]
MPLNYCDGSRLCAQCRVEDLEEVIYLKYGDSSKLLRSQPVRSCLPPSLLYVDQRELAVTTVHDDVINTLGSDDATTCHIAVLRHSGSGATGLCHFDSCGTTQGVQDLVDKVRELSQDIDGRLELHIVGGFKDDDGSSEKLSRKLLSEFHKLSVDVFLLTACISDLNNVTKSGENYPAICGLGVSVKTGEIFPASFAYKGPDKPVRSLRHFIGDKDIKNIYDHTDHRLRISPYSYTPNDFPHAALFLRQSDQTIRQYMSTSPAVEPEHFAQQVRAAITFFLSNPSSEMVFPGGRSHFFKMRQDGHWQLDNQ